MPGKKDNSKAPATEAMEEEINYRDRVETLMLQVEEARALAREAQQKFLLAEESRDELAGRVREYEVFEEENRTHLRDLTRQVQEYEASDAAHKEKERELEHKLSKNYEHLEQCSHDNAVLKEELVAKSKELEATKQARSRLNIAGQPGPPMDFILSQSFTPHSRNQPRPTAPGSPRVSSFTPAFPRRPAMHGLGGIPLPHQTVFDGTSSWESFLKPFLALDRSCGWSHEERLFHLTNGLRGEAAEYAFCYLPNGTLQSFDKLVSALEVRFKDHSPVTAYLAQLEARKLQPREKVSEFLADIRKLVLKSYPTTRESIGVRHFLKGLSHPQMAVAVGMKNPQTLDEARAALDTYSSLKEDLGRVPRVRVAIAAEEDEFVTQQQLRSFKEEIVL